jgi:hypothetical protein
MITMMFLSHILLGIFVLKMVSSIFPTIPFNLQTILITLVLQLLPDLDVFWAKDLSSHHKSYFHAPIFWIGISVIIFIISNITKIIPVWISYIVLIQTVSHLLFDYITARTAGIILYYPFGKKEYSLFKLNKKQGEFNSFEISLQFKFLKHYFENKFLLFFEIIVCILGIVVLLI